MTHQEMFVTSLIKIFLWHDSSSLIDGCCLHYFVKNSLVQPIADRVALDLEIISKTFSTNDNSAHGIYD